MPILRSDFGFRTSARKLAGHRYSCFQPSPHGALARRRGVPRAPGNRFGVLYARRQSVAPVLLTLISAKEAPPTITDCNTVNIWSQNKSITDGLWTACSNCSAYINCFWCPEESTSFRSVPSLISQKLATMAIRLSSTKAMRTLLAPSARAATATSLASLTVSVSPRWTRI